MSTRQRSRSRFTQRAAKRPVQWANLLFQHIHPAAATEVFSDMSPNAIRNGTQETATLRRLILHFDYNVQVALNVAQIAVGIAVVTADALDPIAQIPDPLFDAEQGWLYWTNREWSGPAGSGTRQSWDADIRSMRKLRGGYRLVLITESPATSFPSNISISLRALWSVP